MLSPNFYETIKFLFIDHFFLFLDSDAYIAFSLINRQKRFWENLISRIVQFFSKSWARAVGKCYHWIILWKKMYTLMIFTYFHLFSPLLYREKQDLYDNVCPFFVFQAKVDLAITKKRFLLVAFSNTVITR